MKVFYKGEQGMGLNEVQAVPQLSVNQVWSGTNGVT